MESRELRIGNLISDIHTSDTFYAEVKQITKERVYYGNFHSHPSDLKPIPLTEDLIKKTSLKCEKTLYGKYFFGDSDLFIEVDYDKFIFRHYSGESIRELKYLHELQNLYFSLTGEELILNLNQNNMATVYKIEIVSHWVSYTKEELQKLLENAINKDKELKKYGNEVTIKVQEQI